MDLVQLVRVWLSDRKFYVEVNGITSDIYYSEDGTIQGSVLGPILYAIFVSPLFDLADITNFADDNFIIEFDLNVNANNLIELNDLDSTLPCFKRKMKTLFASIR